MERTPIRVRPGKREDIPKIVWISNNSILPGEDIGFGGGLGSPFINISKLSSVWQEPNIVRGNQIVVAEIEGRGVVGYAKIEERKHEIELVDIDVPIDLHGQGIGTRLVRSIEENAIKTGRRAVTLGTSRNAEGVAWKSVSWWQHLGYSITHEEENDWTRSIGSGTREIRMKKDLD
jgi:ribosomal protein S18 acetylase RimI-like enzyme